MKAFPAAVLFIIISVPVQACDSSGAFGIAFGDQLPEGAKHGIGSDGYVISPPKPDPTFDSYEVFIDSSRKIYSVNAIKQILPFPASDAETPGPEQREAGKERAKVFVASYVSSQKAAGVPFVYQEFHYPPWQAVKDGVMFGVSGGENAWRDIVSCTDIRRENAHVKEVLPGLIKKAQ